MEKASQRVSWFISPILHKKKTSLFCRVLRDSNIKKLVTNMHHVENMHLLSIQTLFFYKQFLHDIKIDRRVIKYTTPHLACWYIADSIPFWEIVLKISHFALKLHFLAKYSFFSQLWTSSANMTAAKRGLITKINKPIGNDYK